MEATTKERIGLLDKILPPGIADAGLEDCALPPESIQEAFRKAADAVKSRAASLFEHEEESKGGGCVADPGLESKGGSDTVIVGRGNEKGTGACLGGKGNEKLDALILGGEGKSCGDGLKEIEVDGIEGSKEKKEKSEDDDDEDEEKPILVEGYV